MASFSAATWMAGYHLAAMQLPRPMICALVAAAIALGACSGGAKPDATPTPTAGPVPSVEQISALVGQGFVGEEIDFSQTLVSAFRDPEAVIDQVKACGAPAGPSARTDASYWPVQLGACYFAANATMRLYQFTHRSEFLDANRLLEHLHQARVEEAQADGANLGDRYWKLVSAAVYDVSVDPGATPSAPAAARGTATP